MTSRLSNLNNLFGYFDDDCKTSSKTTNELKEKKQYLRNHTLSLPKSGHAISVHFDKIDDVIIDAINESEIVVGAIAWLTNFRILKALSKAERIAIVTQKEDFLRRDINTANYNNWRADIRKHYDALNSFDYDDFCESYPGQQEFDPDYNYIAQHWLFNASGMYLQQNDAIRCIGIYPEDGRISPKMHHKFLILGDRDYGEGLIMRPKCVITGSFNLTQNATKSRENIVILNDPEICQAYLSEWAQLWSLSEELDWTSSEPNISAFDIGT